ncbi:MAG: DMT family transporter [Caldilineaceae bacterium]|nr:DMT family transporter [Caldilineaceae bacterium]
MENLLTVLVIAIVAGVAVTLQGNFMGVMTQLMGTRESIFITYGSGGLLISLILLLSSGGNLAAWRTVPPYAFTAGLLGLVIVGAIGYATARYGLIVTFAVMLVAQYASAAMIDHFGLLGATPRPLDGLRLLGIALLVLGAWLTMR